MPSFVLFSTSYVTIFMSYSSFAFFCTPVNIPSLILRIPLLTINSCYVTVQYLHLLYYTVYPTEWQSQIKTASESFLRYCSRVAQTFLQMLQHFSHLDQSRRSKGKAHYQAKLLHWHICCHEYPLESRHKQYCCQKDNARFKCHDRVQITENADFEKTPVAAAGKSME